MGAKTMTAICAYCGWESEGGDFNDLRHKIKMHDEVCTLHPWRTTDSELAEALHEKERFEADHLAACKTMVEVYEAATGRKGMGPEKGLVEDCQKVALDATAYKVIDGKLRKAFLDVDQLGGTIPTVERLITQRTDYDDACRLHAERAKEVQTLRRSLEETEKAGEEIRAKNVALLDEVKEAEAEAERLSKHATEVRAQRDDSRANNTRLVARNQSLVEQVRQAHDAERVAMAKLRLIETEGKDVWFWQGKGDHPESLTCPVVMSADRLREFLDERKAREARITDLEVDLMEKETEVKYTRGRAAEQAQLLTAEAETLKKDFAQAAAERERARDLQEQAERRCAAAIRAREEAIRVPKPEVLDFKTLRDANARRQKEWDAGNQITLAYRGNELGGECGEALNVIKKLERERLGIRGSRDTIEHLAEELADVIICVDLICLHEKIDLSRAVALKFNKTSMQNKLNVLLPVSE